MPNAPGVSSLASPYAVDVTVGKLTEAIASNGLTLFAHVDHEAAAKAMGLQMQPAQVLIFGHPKAGTPLMVATPLLALDLPLKVLIWEDAERKVWVSYNTPEFLAQRYSIPADLVKNISGVETLVRSALAD